MTVHNHSTVLIIFALIFQTNIASQTFKKQWIWHNAQWGVTVWLWETTVSNAQYSIQTQHTKRCYLLLLFQHIC